MFTGIVETHLSVVEISQTEMVRRLWIAHPWTDVRHGESIAVNGCCLTIAQLAPGRVGFDAIKEQKKIYFYSRDGTGRSWKLPSGWAGLKTVTLYPLTSKGRGSGGGVMVQDGHISPKLSPQQPYVLECK